MIYYIWKLSERQRKKKTAGEESNHMEMEIIVGPGKDGRKLHGVLVGRGIISEGLWRKIKWNGRILVNGTAVKAAEAKVNAGDSVRCELQELMRIIPSEKPVDVVYEDEWLLIANKPAGQIIHPTHADITDTLVNRIAGYYVRTRQTAGCHPVYRLDRDTTGLVLIGKQPQIQYALSVSHDCIERSYLALADGNVLPDSGVICAPIKRVKGMTYTQTVAPDGKEACTEYRVLQKYPGFSLVRLKLHTGRTHQIRVHMAHIGYPLLGDALYGGPCDRIKRQALHAFRISFIHPVTKKPIDISVPIPQDMEEILAESMRKDT